MMLILLVKCVNDIVLRLRLLIGKTGSVES